MAGNDDDAPLEPTVFLVIGRVWDSEDGGPEDAVPIHVMLTAPDDDSAVRKTLEALAGRASPRPSLTRLACWKASRMIRPMRAPIRTPCPAMWL